MINWQAIRDALNPTLVCRRYEVTESFYCNGYVERFWSLKRAKAKYTLIFRAGDAMCVTLTDCFIHNEPPPHRLDTPGVEYRRVNRIIWASGQLRTPIVSRTGEFIEWKA